MLLQAAQWMFLVCSCVLVTAQLESNDAGECSPVYVSIDSPLKHVISEELEDREYFYNVCRHSFPFYTLLSHRYLWLTEEEKSLCNATANPHVPLAMYRFVDRPVKWERESPDEFDSRPLVKVFPNDLSHRQNGTLRNSGGVSYNLIKKNWTMLTRASSLYKCAICEREVRYTLNWTGFVLSPWDRRYSPVYAVDVEVDNMNSTRDDVDVVLTGIALALNISVYDCHYLRTTTQENSTEFRINVLISYERTNKTTPRLQHEEDVRETLKRNWNVVSLVRADLCREETLTSTLAGRNWTFNWPEVLTNEVASFSLDSIGEVWASRDCAYNWSTETSYWSKVETWNYLPAKCWREKEEELNRYVDEYSKDQEDSTNPRTTTVNLTLQATSLSKKDFKYHKGNFTTRLNIFSKLISRFDKVLSKFNYSNRNDAALIFSPDIGVNVQTTLVKQKGRDFDGFEPAKDSVLGYFLLLEGERWIVKEIHPNWDPTESTVPGNVKVSYAMLPSSLLDYRNLGVLTFFKYNYLFPTPPNLSLTNTTSKFSYSVSLHFKESRDRLSKEEWFIDVHIYRVDSKNDDASRYKRLWAVHNILTDSEFTTQVCLITSWNESFDVFRCELFYRDSNSIVGSYLEYHNFEMKNDSNKQAVALLSRYAQLKMLHTSHLEFFEIIVVSMTMTPFTIDDKSHATIFNALKSLETIFGKVELSTSHEYYRVYRKTFSFLLADIKSYTDTVVGFSLVSLQNPYLSVYRSIKPIWSNKTSNIYRSSDLAVIVSKDLISVSSRVGFISFNDVSNMFPIGSLEQTNFKMVTAFQITLVKSKNEQITVDEDRFVDIHVNKIILEDSEDGFEDDDLDFKIGCSAWDATIVDWTSNTCSKLKATRGSKEVFRCRQLVQHANILRGIYLIYKYSTKENLSDFLKGNLTLYIIFIILCILSLLGFLIIFFTLILTKTWRSDKGLKILLFMATSVVLNLILGFIHNFIRMDSKSKECILTGALRHYFYLSMFCWMSVLSVLQLYRILTMKGLKNTPRLLLKLSLIAWGIPLAVIGIVLLSNRNAYLSDVEDRGFCYPEGLVFKLTVQAPAGFILVSNMIILIVIYARMNEWFGWGKKEELKRHANKQNLQGRQIRSILSSFMLFGFQWLFHFLSEEGLIQNEFIYEYMFLLTASLHVFVLALLFIMNPKTREEYKEVFIDMCSWKLV